MKVVQFEDVPAVRGLEHRGGTFHSRTTAAGVPGTVGNFKFSVSELGTDYSGPRHRHNFDQYRFMLSGESDYGQDGPLREGMLGYYPEGVPYGPQVNKTPIVCAVLQFGGASGSGYLQPREVKAGMEELKAFGEFKDGVFHRHEGVPGRRNSDAYQAIWEHVHGHEMLYPKGRYDAPIMMDAANYQWAPIKGVRGAAEKLFGVFTERRTERGWSSLNQALHCRSADAASIWFSRAPATRTGSRSGSSPPCFSIPERAARCVGAKRPSCCTTACPICPISRSA
jgi:hypothetical protein